MSTPSRRHCFEILEDPYIFCTDHQGDFNKDCKVCMKMQKQKRMIIGWACHVCRLPVDKALDQCPRCSHLECFFPIMYVTKVKS